MWYRRAVVAVAAVSLIGCSTAGTRSVDPVHAETALRAGETVTVIEQSGEKNTLRFESIDDGVLHGLRYDDGSEYAIRLGEIQALEIESDDSAGRTTIIVSLVALAALVGVLASLPPGLPAPQ